jgi:hypothetical protein
MMWPLLPSCDRFSPFPPYELLFYYLSASRVQKEERERTLALTQPKIKNDVTSRIGAKIGAEPALCCPKNREFGLRS